ncbi:MAG: protein kinase [Alphaproteobacteria bacterium]|nr:protein kinase [Alphaproteobacteria bacterium]
MTSASNSSGAGPGDPAAQQPLDVDFAALRPGQTIGRYEIVSVLGQGGFGITYRARDVQLGRDVAIKEYLPTALAYRQAGTTVMPRTTKLADDFGWGRERFVSEGRTLATLHRTPAIVHVFDFLEANGTAYIVMELLSGETLEDRLARQGKLSPEEVDRILWPLLDGLAQVHEAGFLHRDIKPANILLDAAGNPTLIDFGASRAAMAGRSTAMTAIFTPGYAAAEQMTSAKQGPWTDIYGLSATLHHAITGAPPPSAFDRMLDDEYQPIARRAPAGFSPGVLVGLDAGLQVRAADRPQSIAGWRPILAQSSPLDSNATVAVRQPVVPGASAVPRGSAPQAEAAAPKRRLGLWIGLGAVLLAAAGGGSYFYMTRSAQQAALSAGAEAAKAARDQAELARLRAEKEERDRVDAAARQKAAADEEARKQAAEADRKAAEAGEVALHLSTVDRQHIQVALSAQGFPTNGTNGVFGGHTRDMIAAWQKKRGDTGTGYITAEQNQALLRDAAAAIAKFDDEEKAKSAPPASPPAQAAPGIAVAPPKTGGVDGQWHGSYHCTAGTAGGAFTIPLQISIVNGAGGWLRPNAGPVTTGNLGLSIRITGTHVDVSRSFVPPNRPGEAPRIATLTARLEGNTIIGGGPEINGFGRTCDINLTR